MKMKVFAVALMASVALTACSGESTIEAPDTQDVKTLVSDFSSGTIKNKSASITSQELVVTEDDGSKTVYDLPEADFFVSIAPYINETHP